MTGQNVRAIAAVTWLRMAAADARRTKFAGYLPLIGSTSLTRSRTSIILFII
jgi:hypothetical protein